MLASTAVTKAFVTEVLGDVAPVNGVTAFSDSRYGAAFVLSDQKSMYFCAAALTFDLALILHMVPTNRFADGV